MIVKIIKNYFLSINNRWLYISIIDGTKFCLILY
ncbi:uncharacterized protein METZ01_LOCUS153246 [marine metagenome]|uniref:Uncharacterized protein n=1 Tax=marine metagenome TaxID=408172 RepID=A0A382AH06_9ZZZZ